MFIEGSVADDDAGGVDADVAVDAFEFEGVAPEVRVGGGGLDEFAEFGFGFPLALEGDAGFGLDHFGDAVGLAVGDAHDAGDVADDAFGTHGAVGDDVRDTQFAVFLADVVDDFAAAGLAEVDIDVGRGDAFWVEEAFEEEAELEGADVGDAHGVGDEGSGGGSTAGADGDVIVARPLDEVGGDEEVGREAELVDDIDFVFEALGDFGNAGFDLSISFNKAFTADAHEVFLAG